MASLGLGFWPSFDIDIQMPVKTTNPGSLNTLNCETLSLAVPSPVKQPKT